MLPAPHRAVAVACLLALSGGCRGDAPPVAEVELAASDWLLPHRSFLPVELSWRLNRPLDGVEGEPLVFVHLLDGDGNVVRTFDHPWPGSWRPGTRHDYAVNLYQSALAQPLEAGSYSLTLGVYDRAGNRWPLAAGGQAVDRFEYLVGEVRVPEESGGPTFQFSHSWLPPEAGRNRQVISRRWLPGEGQLEVSGIDRPGTLWLGLWLPAPGASQQLVLSEGATQQGAVLRSGCGGVEASISGPGRHEVELRLEAPADPAQRCTVAVQPSFYLLGLDSLERRALSLEVLAWRPDR